MCPTGLSRVGPSDGRKPVIGNSQGEAGLLQRDFGDGRHVVVIPEGIELPGATAGDHPETLHPVDSPGWTTVLSVGRLEAYKGVQRIVAALAELPPKTRLVVVGSGPAHDAIDVAAVAGGLGDRVHPPRACLGCRASGLVWAGGRVRLAVGA